MEIRDRGKKKLHGAFFMPEQVKRQVYTIPCPFSYIVDNNS